MIHEQHVLAPFHRFVAGRKDLVRLPVPEKSCPLKSCAHHVAQPGEGERYAVLVAMVAELDEAEECRGVQSRHRREIEHDIAYGLLLLSVDLPPDALEKAVGRAEEDKAGEPEHMQPHALFLQQPGLLRRPLDIAREFLTREVAADDADAAIAQREHQAGADHAEHNAHEISEIDDHEHDGPDQAPIPSKERCAGECSVSAMMVAPR